MPHHSQSTLSRRLVWIHRVFIQPMPTSGLRELANTYDRDWRGPSDERGQPPHSIDPLLLSLFAPGETIWDALEDWGNEYVRLKTMLNPAVGISIDNRHKAIRFGYLLACYLESDSNHRE